MQSEGCGEWRSSQQGNAPCLCRPLQANETFAFVGNVTYYARVWLNISAELRAFLEEGKLHNRMAWLQQVTGRSLYNCMCLLMDTLRYSDCASTVSSDQHHV